LHGRLPPEVYFTHKKESSDLEVIKAVKHPNYSNRVKLEPKLDKLTLRPELRALMNSKLSALFFVGKLVWRAK